MDLNKKQKLRIRSHRCSDCFIHGLAFAPALIMWSAQFGIFVNPWVIISTEAHPRFLRQGNLIVFPHEMERVPNEDGSGMDLVLDTGSSTPEKIGEERVDFVASPDLQSTSLARS